MTKTTRGVFKSYCSRCGKERVVSKVWKEKVGLSFVETTEQVCPDKKCQQVIDNEIKNNQKRKLEIEDRHKQVIKNRKKVKKTSKEVNKYG